MVKLLSLGPERAGQGGNALRNPFVRLGAGLLAATLIACPSDNPQNSNPAKPAPAMQSIVGDYTCTALDDKHDAHGHYTRKGSISSFSIYEKKGRFFASDEVSRMLRQFGVSADVQVTKDEKGFHFVSNSFSGTVTSVGRLENGTIKYSRTIANGKTSITFEYECTCKAKKKKEDVEYMKAVFVRPGEYVEKPQLYVKFFANRKTTVGGGTLRSVAQDLLNSGVTDVFLALKTDWAWPPGGHRGSLLYNSRYVASEDSDFTAARATGFDPPGALMNACQTAYAAAGKTVRFHAWFPVFGDEYAAKNFGGQSVYFDKGLPGNVWGFLTRAKPDCMSDMFADPSNSAAINYELSILGDLIKDYPALSGINLDYIRYVDPGTICNGANRTGTPLNYVNPAAVENFVKLVKARFPSLTLSADVIADSATRVKVGQEGILQYLDMIVPMVYSYTDNNNSGSSTVKDWVKRIRDRYPSKILLPLLRGYTEGITNPYSKGLMTDLASDLSAVKTVKIDGYGIFTYEYLLDNANAQKLSCIKKKIGY